MHLLCSRCQLVQAAEQLQPVVHLHLLPLLATQGLRVALQLLLDAVEPLVGGLGLVALQRLRLRDHQQQGRARQAG